MAILQITRNETDILRDGREYLSQKVGITADNETSTALNLLRTNAKELANMWETMNTLLRKGFLSTAFADGLDEIGVLLQEPRAQFKRAMDLGTTNVKFYLDETYAKDITDLVNRYLTLADRNKLVQLQVLDDATNGSQLRLPANILVMSANTSISYNCINPIILSNNQTFDYSPVIANGVGEAYNVAANTLNSHNIASLIPILAKVIDAIKVRNQYAIRNGGDIESDENYRFRLSNKVVSAVSSNDASIRKAVLSVPGVVDLSLVPRTHGNGTFTIFPKSSDPILSDGILNAVNASVQSTMAAGAISYIEAPEYMAVSIRIELRFAPGADKNALYANIRLTVMDYINNLDLGDEIIINEIIQRVMSLDDKIIDMSISQFGFGFYDRLTGAITDYTPLRLLNQRADWNQKWFINASLCSICEAGSQ